MTALKIIIVVALAAAAIIGCTEDDGPSAEQKFMDRLAGQWSLAGGRVTLGEMDVSGSFVDLELNVGANKGYSASAPVDPIWPAQGTFRLIKNDAGLFNLLRNDEVLIEVTELTEHSFKFNQQHEADAGRTKTVSYIFRQ
jgi:hypothetical protein